MSWSAPPEGRLSTHFTWREAACRCCGRIPSETAVRETAEWLERVRAALGGRAILVNSWSRCPKHNQAVGGVPTSLHQRGIAVDLRVAGMTPAQVQEALRAHQECGLIGGLGSYKTFTHIDRGPKKSWRG
jgi:zinc D-Ala-D-Ala carboxypeptidase